MWKNWNLCVLLMETENGAAAMENGMAVTQKLNTELPMIKHFWIYTQKN